MLSYNWGAQDTVKKIKTALETAGFNVWMDVDQMAGSTLEASMLISNCIHLQVYIFL